MGHDGMGPGGHGAVRMSYFLCVALSFVSLFFRNEFNFFISLTIISVSVGDALVSLYVRYFYLLPVFLLLFPSI